MPSIFTGPVFVETRPFQSAALWSRLAQQITYGMSVWRDAGGTWHQQYGPSPEQLAGATAVYAGGRRHTLTAQQAADLTAGGFGALIVTTP